MNSHSLIGNPSLIYKPPYKNIYNAYKPGILISRLVILPLHLVNLKLYQTAQKVWYGLNAYFIKLTLTQILHKY